jgi:peptidoglycan/xylan/chitin deacetylase (PgdA/CDA1 family)
MTHEELRLVAAEPAIELGGHSVTHSRLAALSHNAQHEEIEGSRSFLTDLTGKQPTSFAFPFGNTGDFTPATVDLVRDAGFQRACTTIRHAVDRSTDSYTLPRIHVENWRKDRFSKWLRKELREGQSPQAWS